VITQLATVNTRVPGLGMFKPQNYQIKKQTTAISEDLAKFNAHQIFLLFGIMGHKLYVISSAGLA